MQGALGRGFHVDQDHRMVHVMVAHVGVVHDRGDAVPGQVIGGTDTGEHQQLGGVDRPGRHDDFPGGPDEPGFAVPLDFDADRGAVLDPDPEHEGVGQDVEVAPLAGRVDVAVGGRPPPPSALGHLVKARADLFGPVEVIVCLQAGRGDRLDELEAHLVRGPQVLNAERTAGAVVVIGAAGVVLRHAEQREHVRIRPSGGSVFGPEVVVGLVAADVDHGVHRGAAAEHLGSWHEDPAPAQVRLGLGEVAPVQLGLELLGERRGHLHVHVLVAAAGLDEQHPVAG